MMLLYKRNLEGALEQCDHTIELNPHSPRRTGPSGWCKSNSAISTNPSPPSNALFSSLQDPRLQAALARVFALEDMRGESLAILDDLQSLSNRRYVSPFAFALIHLALGGTDTGFEWLDKAFQDRWFELLFIKADPRFDPFRDDTRFISICYRVGLL